MFSHLTDWELTVYGFVIAIFTIAPLPLFPDRHPQPKPFFHISQSVRETPMVSDNPRSQAPTTGTPTG